VAQDHWNGQLGKHCAQSRGGCRNNLHQRQSDSAHVSHHIHDGCECLSQHSIAFLLQIRDLWIHSGSRQCFLMMIKDRVGFWGNGIKELFVADHIRVLVGGGQRILIRCRGRLVLVLPPASRELCHHAANLSLDEQKTISQHRQDHANDHWHWELA